MDDLSKELHVWGMDVIGITETKLRERVELYTENHRMIGKGRSKWKKKGGGVGIIVRKKIDVVIEEIKVGECEMSEDMMAAYLNYKARGKTERIFLIVCYMTVQGPDARRDNERKYDLVRRLVNDHRREQVIIMGDMNGHIGILGEEVNANGQMLIDFTEEYGLEILNQTIAEGRVTWVGRNGESAIDYILVNEKARRNVEYMRIDEEREMDVTSDHNMLLLQYACVRERKKTSKPKGKKWKLKQADWKKFGEDLERVNWIDDGGVDRMNEELTRTVKEVAERRVGRKKKGKNKRPQRRWWNLDIESAMKKRKESNRKCRRLRVAKDNGENERVAYEDAWEEYKKHKSITGCLIRKARVKADKDVVQELKTKGGEVSREWYDFLRGEQESERVNVEVIMVDGREVRGKPEKAREVKEFWKNIGGANEVEDRSEANLIIGRKIPVYENMDHEISRAEISKCVKKLKTGKAAGNDEIPYEFYKEGGNGIIEGMHGLFKNVWSEERVPRKWNESRVTLLHKGGHKSKKELKNYRPITLTDTISKVFCGVLNERLKGIFERNKVMGEEQNGFRMDRRGEDNMFVVREVIENMKKSGRKGYFAFLDIEKAYDRVNRYKMCKILETVGVSEKIVNIIKSMYENTRARYSMGDIETDWVESKRGVRQGCGLSPLLFGLYTEELAVRMKEADRGIRVGNECLSILLYADDVVVMSDNREDLQRMLDIVSEYANDLNVSFSREKSQVLVINGDETDVDATWRLGNNIISRTNEYKYLGMTVDANGCEKTKGERLTRASQWVGRLGSAARCRANKYEVVRGVWKGMAVPGLMYGLETIPWTANDLAKLEVAQNRVGRLALGANKYTAVEALRGDAGWSSFEERIDKGALRYRVRLEKMNGDRWARKVFEWSKQSSKWNKMCNKRIEKYGMRGIMMGESMQMWSPERWKKEIGRRVQEVARDEWAENMRNKSSLEWYRCKQQPRREPFYDGSIGSELIFKARTKSLELNSRTYRWANEGNKACKMCESGEDETVEHILLKCVRYERERREMLGAIVQEIGEDEWNDVVGRYEWVIDRIVIYLLGLSDLNKWNESTAQSVKDYLEVVWRRRSGSL